MNTSTRILLVLFLSYAMTFMLVAGNVPFDRAIGKCNYTRIQYLKINCTNHTLSSFLSNFLRLKIYRKFFELTSQGCASEIAPSARKCLARTSWDKNAPILASNTKGSSSPTARMRARFNRFSKLSTATIKLLEYSSTCQRVRVPKIPPKLANGSLTYVESKEYSTFEVVENLYFCNIFVTTHFTFDLRFFPFELFRTL